MEKNELIEILKKNQEGKNPEMPHNQAISGKNADVDFSSQDEKIMSYIDNLTAFGVFTPEQGQNLKQYYSKIMNIESAPKVSQINPFDEFEKENPTFFESRENLKKYLKNAEISLDKEEFNKIFVLVNELENSAVERYKNQVAQAKMLDDANSLAKDKLNTLSNSVQNGTQTESEPFTRAQIKSMSANDFAKNEAKIMDQLAKGLIM